MIRHNHRLAMPTRIGHRYGVSRYKPIDNYGDCKNSMRLTSAYDTSFEFTAAENAAFICILQRVEGDSEAGFPTVEFSSGVVEYQSDNTSFPENGAPFHRSFIISGLTIGSTVTVTIGPKEQGSLIEDEAVVFGLGITGSGSNMVGKTADYTREMSRKTTGGYVRDSASRFSREAVSMYALSCDESRGRLVPNGGSSKTKVKEIVCQSRVKDVPEIQKGIAISSVLCVYSTDADESGYYSVSWNTSSDWRSMQVQTRSTVVLGEGYGFTSSIKTRISP